MWHNEVRNHLQQIQNPKKVKKQQINQIVTKFAPTELDADSHSPELDIATIHAITAIKHEDAITEASNEEI